MARVGDRGPLVLHGWWSLDSRLRLWGEGAARLGRRTGPRSTRTGTPRVPGHSFAVSTRRLGDALSLAGAELRHGRAVLLLPSAGGGPIASNAMPPWRVPASRGRRVLAPWSVPVLTVPAGPAIDVLPSISQLGVAGIVLGDSITFLARALEIALEVAARGRLLPGVGTDPGGRAVARWLPVPLPDQDERIRLLAEAMPPSCRAELTDSSGWRGARG